MKTRLCSYPKCNERRVHHEQPDEMRAHQTVELPDGHEEDDPYYCSITCACMDGWMSIRYETKEQIEARQEEWRRARSAV